MCSWPADFRELSVQLQFWGPKTKMKNLAEKLISIKSEVPEFLRILFSGI
jgi:hypothetical protein